MALGHWAAVFRGWKPTGCAGSVRLALATGCPGEGTVSLTGAWIGADPVCPDGRSDGVIDPDQSDSCVVTRQDSRQADKVEMSQPFPRRAEPASARLPRKGTWGRGRRRSERAAKVRFADGADRRGAELSDFLRSSLALMLRRPTFPKLVVPRRLARHPTMRQIMILTEIVGPIGAKGRGSRSRSTLVWATGAKESLGQSRRTRTTGRP